MTEEKKPDQPGVDSAEMKIVDGPDGQHSIVNELELLDRHCKAIYRTIARLRARLKRKTAPDDT